MEKTITFTQIKSAIGSPQSIRATLIGLGLTRLYKKCVRKDCPEVRGMLKKVNHLVRVEE